MQAVLKSLRLLGDPMRVRILLLLRCEELSVAEMQEILAQGQSKISTHLAQLKHAGLVEDRRTGKNIFYRLRAVPHRERAVLDQLFTIFDGSPDEISERDADREALNLVLEKRKDRTRTYFDSLAGRFGRAYLPGRSWQGLAEILLRLMPSMVIADLGAGEGTFSQLLAQCAQQVIAIDNSPKMVEYGASLAREHKLHNLEFRLGDIEDVPIRAGTVDLAFFSQSLHHAQHPPRAMQEAWRILKPGGRVAILDLLRHQFEEARELYADVWLGFTEVELRRFLKGAAFYKIQTAVVHREPEPPYFETICALGEKPRARSS
jgi:ArsR family transcriptional regulator